MRRVRVVVVVAAGVCALGAFSSQAFAEKVSEAPLFTASKVTKKGPSEFPLMIKGVGVGPQEFTFKALNVVCQEAKVKGSIAEPTSKTIALVVSYKECSAGPLSFGNIKKVTLPIKFKEKANFTYHFNGFVNSEEEIEMKVKYLGCLVNLDSGVIPEKAEEAPNAQYSSASYTSQEGKLLISNEFKKAEWEEEGGGLCEEPGIELSEGETGKYKGSLLVEVPKGTLGLEE